MQRSKSMKWRANMKALHARRTWGSACQSDARQNTRRAPCGKEHCGKNKTFPKARCCGGITRCWRAFLVALFRSSVQYASGLMSLNSDFCRDAKRTIWNLQESISSCCGPWPGLCSTDAHIVDISHQAQSIASRPKCRWIYFTYYHN